MCLAVYVLHTHTYRALARHFLSNATRLNSFRLTTRKSVRGRERKSQRSEGEFVHSSELRHWAKERAEHGEFAHDSLSLTCPESFLWMKPIIMNGGLRRQRRNPAANVAVAVTSTAAAACRSPFVVWAGKDKICFCFCLIKKLLFLSLARLLCYFIKCYIIDCLVFLRFHWANCIFSQLVYCISLYFFYFSNFFFFFGAQQTRRRPSPRRGATASILKLDLV